MPFFKTKGMEKSEITERLKAVFNGSGYDYSLVEDSRTKDDIFIICPKHGRFKKRLERALKGSGCPQCSGKAKKTFEDFKEQATSVHGGKYIYNDTNYRNAHTCIGITCPIHGEFKQSPTNHLNGNGCPKCKAEKLSEEFSSSITDFIEKADKVHGNKYDYSQAVYVNSTTPTMIICPKHGEFFQTPKAHLSGRGCPMCNESHLERDVRKLLDSHKIPYEYQWHLPWSKYYSLDFYVPKYNVGIECQGIQHFEEGHFIGSDLTKTRERDEYKLRTCTENGIKILYFSNLKGKGCITDGNTLIEKITGNEGQKG